jgi:hypothetical protein
MNQFLIKLAIIILIGILPSLASLLILRRVKQRWQMRLRRARLMTGYHRQDEWSWHNYGDRSREPERYSIGDASCRFNAHSPYIRCAVNPCGPCKDCPHYEPKT